MRPIPLTVLKGGINRQRIKGGASINQLYDLQNAYITVEGAVVPREGTITTATLTSATKGLAVLDGVFNVFSTSAVTVPSGFQDSLLVHPTISTANLEKIWFAKPFMGFLYVTAEFNTGDIFDYWLQNNGTWTSSSTYTTGNIVLPQSPNGLAYLAVRDLPTQPTWTAQTITTTNAQVEPTEYTGFYYRAVAVAGTSPHTSSTEPVWPTVAGGTVQEFGDFDLSSTDAGTTTANATISTSSLGANITDRYGDSADIAAGGSSVGAAIITTATVSTNVTTWQPGTNYAPGAVVRPSKTQGAYTNAIPNGDFENGNDGSWVFTGDIDFTYSNTGAYQGSYCLSRSAGYTASGGDYAIMNQYATIAPGQSVTISAYLDPNNVGANLEMWVTARFYNSSDVFISETLSNGGVGEEGGGYRLVSVTATAPAGAAHVRAAIRAGSGTSSGNACYADLVTWNLEQPAAVSNFLYEAVQGVAGASASTEPTWPTTLDATVVDGGVTWEAIGTSIITWEAIPIMYSGTTEPSFPTTIGNTVYDASTYTDSNGNVLNTSMSWECTNRQIIDTSHPNTIPTVIGASHVFKGNIDITSYSAAVDPTDWETANNAGYLPTGLNNYGDNPVAMLALYRSNLMVFNAGGYQMWQIDPDPQNMALLDAEPIGSIWPQAAQSVANDLLFLTEVGVRNIGTVGATANMQIGNTGQPVDPIVVPLIKAGTYKPISLYYPGRGQYWLIFGPQAIVLTINGSGQKNWSRYIFPDSITDWALNGEVLYLRTAGNLVWQFDEDTLVDSYSSNGGSGSTTVLFCTFDGTVGEANFTDQSYTAAPLSVNSGQPNVLSSASLFSGENCLYLPGNSALDNYFTAFPYTYGSRLDLFQYSEWTIQLYAKIPSNTSSAGATVISVQGNDTGGGYSGAYIQLTDNGDGTTTLYINFAQAFTGSGTISQTFTVTTGQWHHIAVAMDGSTTRAFFDGVQLSQTRSDWILSNRTENQTNPCVQFGVQYQYSGSYQPAYIEQVKLDSTCLYTTGFTPPGQQTVTTGITFNGVIQWPYLDLNSLAANKMMMGFDLVGDGDVQVQFGWNQQDPSTFNDNATFTSSSNVSDPYTLTIAGTVPGTPVPMPLNSPSVTVILTFPGNQEWSWEAFNLYVVDQRGAGTYS